MSWLTFLNPLNWIKVLSLLKSIWDMGVSAYSFVVDWFQKRKQQKTVDQMKDAESKIDDANKNPDEASRLQQKAEEACVIEKSLDPNSDC